MARSDLLISLAKAANSGDQNKSREITEAIIAEENRKNHRVLARRLKQTLFEKFNGVSGPRLQDMDNLLREQLPERAIDSLVLKPETKNLCFEVIEEQQRADLLRSYGLEPRNSVMLEGPPGNGKTSLAEAIAYELYLPLYTVRYEGLIGSLLGETSSRLSKIFDYVRTQPCVFFIDEFDTIGKERGDTNETGEIKRVVSSLLLQVDRLPSYVVVVTATNHPELLDRATWRRFDLKLTLSKPTRVQIKEWFIRAFEEINENPGYSAETIAKYFSGYNFSEIEDFWLDVKRGWILSQPGNSLRKVIGAKLKYWKN